MMDEQRVSGSKIYTGVAFLKEQKRQQWEGKNEAPITNASTLEKEYLKLIQRTFAMRSEYTGKNEARVNKIFHALHFSYCSYFILKESTWKDMYIRKTFEQEKNFIGIQG